jgi:hypothetical protein
MQTQSLRVLRDLAGFLEILRMSTQQESGKVVVKDRKMSPKYEQWTLLDASNLRY